jgi:putative ABC transport system permease protein
MAVLEQWFSHAVLRGRSLFRRGEMNRDLNEEFQYHLDRKTNELLAAGVSPLQASRAAQIAMGGVEQAKEECRDAWGLRWVYELGQDVRYGARLLGKAPVFALSAIGMLGVAIGAIAVVSSMVDAMLLRPFPYRGASDLVFISQQFANQKLQDVPFSAAEVDDFRNQIKTLENAAAFRHTEFNVGRDDAAERVIGAAVTANLFDLLGVAPLFGRTFDATDSGRAVPAIVIGEALWRRRFGADAGIVGKQVRLSGRDYSVIGVMPGQFRFPLPRFNVRGPAPGTAEVWKITRISPAEMSARSARTFHMVGRLGPGFRFADLADELKQLGDDWMHRFPQAYGEKNFSLVAQPLREAVAGRIKPALWILGAAVVAVLLIALFNLTAILLARGIGRKGEFALRMALGAGRIRLARQLITEGLLLASAGAAVGLGLAGSVLPVLRSMAAQTTPLIIDSRINGSVLLCIAATGIASGLCLGVIPAFAIAFGSPAAALQNRQRTFRRVTSWDRVRDVLVIAEIALGLVLLVCAISLTQNLGRLRTVALGFDPADVLTMEVSLPPASYPDDPAVAGYFATVLQRTKALPELRTAAFASVLPLSGVNQDRSFTIEGIDHSPGHIPDEELRIVTPEYFHALSIPMHSGRTFTGADNLSAPPVAIINKALAQRDWPGGDALGRRIMLNDSPGRWIEVVGIVGNIRHKGIDQPERPEFYLPHAQFPVRLMTMVAKTNGSRAAALSGIRGEIRAIDPELPVASIRTLEQVVANSVAPQRLAAAFVRIFAAIALALGVIGMYSVMSFHFAERKTEIAMRLALGAERRHIVRLILRRSLGLVALGGLIGSAVILTATNSLVPFIQGTQQVGARTFASALLAFLGFGLAAAFVPALRAARTDRSLSRRLC